MWGLFSETLRGLPPDPLVRFPAVLAAVGGRSPCRSSGLCPGRWCLSVGVYLRLTPIDPHCPHLPRDEGQSRGRPLARFVGPGFVVLGFWGLLAVLRRCPGVFSAFGRGEMLAFFFGGQFFPPSGALWWLLDFGARCVLGLVPELDLVVPQPRSQDPDLRFLRTVLVREGFGGPTHF